MIALDMSQMTDPHFTNVIFPTNYSFIPNLDIGFVPGLGFVQGITNNGTFTPVRTNQVEDIFLMMQTNATWLGVGYSVSNWFTNAGGGAIPGVGSLYRYVSTINGPLYATNLLYTTFSNNLW